MLTWQLLHPQILQALAGAGHGSVILVADGNYPASTTRGPNAHVVHLNLRPGMVDAVTVVEVLAGAVPVEAAWVMAPLTEGPYAMDGDPPIWAEFSAILDAARSRSALDRSALERVALEPVPRADFYAAAARPEVALVVVTGETRLYGNLLLRIGVVQS